MPQIEESALAKLKDLADGIIEGREKYNHIQLDYMRTVIESMREKAKDIRLVLNFIR